MSITLNANNDGSGSVQTGGIDAIQISAAQNVTVPNNLTVTNASTFTGNVSGVLKSGTAVASTSGTSIDFTGIPATAKRITVMFSGVSININGIITVQIGGGSPTTSGYAGLAVKWDNGGGGSVNLSNGFNVQGYNGGSGDIVNGILTIANLSGNTWTASGSCGPSDGNNKFWMVAGSVTIGATLDRVRITTVGGTATFDLGTVNIMWE